MLTQYQLLYQISPIFLQNGIATNNITGNMLPLLNILDPNAFVSSSAFGATPTVSDWTLEDAFAIFQPAPGGSLIQQSIGEFPYANLNVAANAVLRNPINVSMIMVTPMKQKGSWTVKMNKMTALKQTLDNHNNAGGTYVVFTPAFIYQDMLMLSLTDISTTQSALPQNAWKWDFTRPLVQLAELANAQSNMTSKLTGGLPITMDTTGQINMNSALSALGLPAATFNQGSGAGGTVPGLIAPPIATGGLVN